jgi:hypothetical protein
LQLDVRSPIFNVKNIITTCTRIHFNDYSRQKNDKLTFENESIILENESTIQEHLMMKRDLQSMHGGNSGVYIYTGWGEIQMRIAKGKPQ